MLPSSRHCRAGLGRDFTELLPGHRGRVCSRSHSAMSRDQHQAGAPVRWHRPRQAVLRSCHDHRSSGAKRECFGDVVVVHDFGPGKVGNGLGHPCHLPETACAKCALTKLLEQDLRRFRRQDGFLRRSGIGRSSCDRDSGRNIRRTFRRDAGQQFAGSGSGYRHHQVESVQKWCGDTSAVTSAHDHRTRARPLVNSLAAGARIHGGHEQERRRKFRATRSAVDPDHAFLQWLTQRFECRDWKLAEFIQEEHPVSGQARLTRTRRRAPTSDERDDCGLVMRCTERRSLEQRGVGQGDASARVDARHRHRLFFGKRRQ